MSRVTEESGQPQDDKPQMLIKLQERKERHKERHPIARAGVVVFGFLLVLVGIVLSGPGVPGPGFLVILLGLGFLALEFDRAERLLEKAIVFGDKLADRAEETTTAQRVMGGIAAALAIGAFVAAAILWDIPLLPV